MVHMIPVQQQSSVQHCAEYGLVWLGLGGLERQAVPLLFVVGNIPVIPGTSAKQGQGNIHYLQL